jgi:hypothetical protein
MPVWVFSCDLRGFLGWGIRFRTNGIFNHVMMMRRQGKFATQNLTFREVPIDKYNIHSNIMEFWTCINMPDEVKCRIRLEITKQLKESVWKRFYDVLGIFGQAVGLRWIQLPWFNYCTERVGRPTRVILPDLPKRLTPKEMREYFRGHPYQMKCLGQYVPRIP